MKDIGPIVPIVTPCTRSGEIDVHGFRRVCQEMLTAGCAGIFVGGSTGRGPWFNLKDRAVICQVAADCIERDTLLLGGCTALGLPGMIEAARVMADSGARAVVATAPGYFHYDQEEVEAYEVGLKSEFLDNRLRVNVAVFDNEYTASQDRMALYLDGDLAASSTGVDWDPGIFNTTTALHVGGYAGINALQGWMDEVRRYEKDVQAKRA